MANLRYVSIVSCRPRDQRPNTSSLLSPLLKDQAHSHTTPQVKKKHRHHGPPNPLAPDGSNFTGECNQSRSLRSGDVTFIDETNKSFILLTIILCAAAQHARGQKVSF